MILTIAYEVISILLLIGWPLVFAKFYKKYRILKEFHDVWAPRVRAMEVIEMKIAEAMNRPASLESLDCTFPETIQ